MLKNMHGTCWKGLPCTCQKHARKDIHALKYVKKDSHALKHNEKGLHVLKDAMCLNVLRTYIF